MIWAGFARSRLPGTRAESVGLNPAKQVQKNQGITRGVHGYVAQVIPQIDAEIAEKGHFWMETAMKRALVNQKILLA